MACTDGQPTTRRYKQTLARAVVDSVVGTARYWQGGCVDAEIGLALVEVHYTGNPWVSARYVSNRLASISVDTVRRTLEKMVDRGLVEVIEIDTRKLYRACRGAAEETSDILAEAAQGTRA